MWFRRRQFEAEMSEELRFHLEQYTQELIAQGVTPNEAHRRARLEFGGVNSVQEECREAGGWRWFDEFRRQAAYAARLLRKSPGFTATALATLALCFGATLTIFAVLDAILLRPLPFPTPSQLVTLYNTYPQAGVLRDGASIPNYYERRGQIPALSSLSLFRPETTLIGEADSTERVPSALVTHEFFATLGIAPLLGRAFTDAETTFQTDHVAILTHDYWQSHYQADPAIVGRPLRVDDLAYKIIGVLPPGFRFLDSPAQIYLPLASLPSHRGARDRHSGGGRTMVARLRPGATLAQAQAQIDAQNQALEAGNPQGKMMAEAGFRSIVAPLQKDHVAVIRPTLLLLQVGVLLLLFIGAVNLVNLLLVRASGRRQELAVRQALGASRANLISEVLVETVPLALLGGILGCGVGALGIRLLTALGAGQLPLGARLTFDARIAAAALAGALLLGLLLAVPVAWFTLHRANRPDESRGGTAGLAAQRLRYAFIVSQMALAFALLAGAGQLALSWQNAAAVPPGFQPDHTLTAQLSLPWARYPGRGPAHNQLVANLSRVLEEQPGVLAAGVANNLPFSGKAGKSSSTVKGYVPSPGESVQGHYSYGVAGHYFAALGLPLHAGRYLAPDEPTRVCVIDEDFARRYWPHTNPLGQKLYPGSDPAPTDEPFTVVGVVGRVKQAGLTDPALQGAVYYPHAYFGDNEMYLVARTRTPPEAFALTLQRTVRSLDAALPVADVRSMEKRIAESLLPQRSPALLAALFSAIALLLTAIGTYGVLSYSVQQRRREIAVRMALGARPSQVGGQFLRLAGQLFAAGVAVGLSVAWLTGRTLQTVLFEVPALHWPTLGKTALLLAAVSLCACLLPSYRAARTSPRDALAE